MQHIGLEEGLRKLKRWRKSVLIFNFEHKIHKKYKTLATEKYYAGTETVRSSNKIVDITTCMISPGSLSGEPFVIDEGEEGDVDVELTLLSYMCQKNCPGN